MTSVRFSKVVEKSGRPEVYLLMSETDAEFHKALESNRIMSLSDDSHGAGTEYGTVGYNKKRRGQMLVFPKSLKAFAGAKIIGIKYDLFSEDRQEGKKPTARASKKEAARPKALRPKQEPRAKRTKTEASQKKADAKLEPRKVIPFPAKKEEPDEDDADELKSHVRQAMRALEKGNSVAAYNILKRIVP